MGATASNVPSFRGQSALSLGDLQDLVEVVKALMLQADAPPGRVRTGSAKAVPAHNPPESGVYFDGKFFAQRPYFRPRPGLVQDLAFQEGLTEPCFVQGHGLLPLAEADEMSTSGADSSVGSSEGSGVGSSVGSSVGKSIPGGIAGIRYVADLTAPRIAPGGIIELPPGGGGTAPVPLAQWDKSGGSQVAGLIGGLSFMEGEEPPFASQGHIYFPLAETVDASGVDRASAVAGAIAGVRYASDSSVDAPRILSGGIIELPPGGGGTADVPLAQWNYFDASPVAGLVRGLSIMAGRDAPYADYGNIYFPLAETVDESGVAWASAIAGAIAGVQYAGDSSVDAPRILPGGIIELPPAAGALRGIVDASGVAVRWPDVEGAAGSQIRVASVFVPVADGLVTPLSLYAGYSGGYLTFSLSDSI